MQTVQEDVSVRRKSKTEPIIEESVRSYQYTIMIRVGKLRDVHPAKPVRDEDGNP